MTTEDTAKELAKLRAEIAELRAAESSAAESAEPTDESNSAETGTEIPQAEELQEDLHGRLGELAELLETEIRDLPTVTCLLVFTAGILLGRQLR